MPDLEPYGRYGPRASYFVEGPDGCHNCAHGGYSEEWGHLCLWALPHASVSALGRCCHWQHCRLAVRQPPRRDE